jgi:twinkle protein
LAKALDCKYIFLDHLSIVVSAMEEGGDERKLIDRTMTLLRTLVQETGIGLIIVSHLKRPDGKGHEEGAQTSLNQLRGSHAIAQLSDMVIGLERNQQGDTPNETVFRVLKNRFSGETGEAGSLFYNTDTGRLTEVPTIDGEF